MQRRFLRFGITATGCGHVTIQAVALVARAGAPLDMLRRFFSSPVPAAAASAPGAALLLLLERARSAPELAALHASSGSSFTTLHHARALARAADLGGAEGAEFFERHAAVFAAHAAALLRLGAASRGAVGADLGSAYSMALWHAMRLRLRAPQVMPLLALAPEAAPLCSGPAAARSLYSAALLAGGAWREGDPRVAGALRALALAAARLHGSLSADFAVLALHAVARLRLDGDAECGASVAPLVTAAARAAGSMKPQAVSDCLWALGKMDAALARGGAGGESAWPAAPLLAAAAAIAGRIGGGGFNAQEISNCLFAAAKLGVRAPATVGPLADAAARLTPSFNPMDASSCLWAAAGLGLNGAPCVAPLAAAAAAHAPAFNEMQTKNAVAAVWKLRITEPTLLTALAAALTRLKLPSDLPSDGGGGGGGAPAGDGRSHAAASSEGGPPHVSGDRDKALTAVLQRAAAAGGAPALRAAAAAAAAEGALSPLHEVAVCMECVKLKTGASEAALEDARALFEAHASRWLARRAATASSDPRAFHSAATLLRGCAAFRLPPSSALVLALCTLVATKAPTAAPSEGAGAAAEALYAVARLGVRDTRTVAPLAAAAARAATAASDLPPHSAAEGLYGVAHAGSPALARDVAVVGPLAAAAAVRAPHMGAMSAVLALEGAAKLRLGERFAAPLVDAVARCAAALEEGPAERAVKALEGTDEAVSARKAALATLRARLRQLA
jgi:hypothetical protein